MSGLGKVSQGSGLYLSIAGGLIWNRKADASDPAYREQTYPRKDGSEGVRKGAAYGDLTGTVIGVQFRTHQEYGESINVTIVDDSEERYIVSVSTNNRYSQDMMKALLKADLSLPVFMKPYDFIGQDKKRATGISFRQNGEKINLRNDDAPNKEAEWFKKSDKKSIRRFFEDLNDWFVSEVEEKVCSQFANAPVKEKEKPKSGLGSATASTAEGVEEAKEEPAAEAPKVSPIKMKKAIKAYIEENYEGKSLPKLSKPDLAKWYDLVLQEEELPFEEEGGETNSPVEESDLTANLNALMAK